MEVETSGFVLSMSYSHYVSFVEIEVQVPCSMLQNTWVLISLNLQLHVDKANVRESSLQVWP